MAGMNGSSVSSRRSRSTAAQRIEWAQRFFQSGLSQREFALRQGLRLSTLQRWLQRSARTSPPAPATAPSFAELKLPPLAASAPRWGAELHRPDGTSLRLAHDVSAALVRQLLRAW
jgi:transcriptional regulator with XRE-family HTH domain